MYVGETHAGAVIFHTRWGLGRVVRFDERCVVAKFGAGRRHKLAYNDQVAVWEAKESAVVGHIGPATNTDAAKAA